MTCGLTHLIGIYALINLGKEATSLFPSIAASRNENFVLKDAGDLFYHAGILFSILLWGFAMWWLFIAIFAVLDHIRTG